VGGTERNRLNKYTTFVELLRDKAHSVPGQVAFTFLQDGETEAGQLTYQDIDIRSRAIAAKLQNYDSQGERALLLYPPGLEFITAFLGCLYAGVIATPAYPPRPNRSVSRLQAIVADSEAKFALTTQSLIDEIENRFEENPTAKRVTFLATDRLNLDLSSQWRSPDINAETIAFLQYTSGSTGIPKGVIIAQGNLMANSRSINHSFQNDDTHKAVSWLPPYHDMGLIGCILQPIYAGVSMHLMPPVAFLQRPYRWLQAISRYQANSSGAPNFAYDLCVSQISEEQKENLDLSHWKLAFTGAEPVRAKTLSNFAEHFSSCGFRKEAFYPCYGMAESTLFITGGDRNQAPIAKTFSAKALEEDKAIAAESDKDSISLVSSGYTLEGQKLEIVRPDTLTVCQDGEVGEIWAASPSVGKGYWNRPELTEASFKAYLNGDRAVYFLRTGDLGFLSDGELFVTGRLKDLIIIRGRNHYPQDIELTIDKSHPAIKAGATAAFSVEIDGEERLVITPEIKRTYLRNLDVDAVTSEIRKAIVQNHEIQTHAVVLLKTGSIPKTSSGKIQRHACKKGFLEDSLNVVGKWEEKAEGFLKSEVSGSTSSPTSQKSEGFNKAEGRRTAGEQIGGNLRFSRLQKAEGLVEGESSNSRSSAPQPPQTPTPLFESIQNWLISQLAGRLGILEREIDVREPLANYGLDSVQAVRLSAELEDWLEVKLSPTIIYDYPNIFRLAEYLADRSHGESQTRIIASKNRREVGEIAIVGMGCRFPGANNPDEFWQLLHEGQDKISQVKSDRWQGEEWGGFLDKVDEFDPQFFGISPRETQRMDPQQRLLLEVSWEALEQAGIAPDKLAGSSTGVFMGMSSSDYSQLQFHYGIPVDAYAGTGNAHSIAANRISYFFDFKGPSLTVDTACSSSLVAVHLACQSLQNEECDRALVGGVNLMLSPELHHTFSQAGMMAADGRCKTFDASADGYVRGEGCGVIVLKKIEDAIADGDNILAVIKGSAIAQDGRSNGLTAPNGLSQQAVIRQALANAGVEPKEVSYIEAHGTGTSLGDPIEVNSLKNVLMENRSLNETCYVGSVKTNIGHLEAAAGIASLIKTVLCLVHREIPPHLHLKQLNPHIDLDNTAIAIPTQSQAWTREDGLRIAGVSSFGFGGTNAHVVLEGRRQEAEGSGSTLRQAQGNASSPTSQKSEVKSQKSEVSIERPQQILAISAKTEEALMDLAANYVGFLDSNPEVDLADVCFTANVGRSHFPHRLAIAFTSGQDLEAKLKAFLTKDEISGLWRSQSQKQRSQKIAWLFTGQGSQYVDMGYKLYQTQPTFRNALDRCSEILEPYLEKSLIELIYPQERSSDRASEINAHILDETAYTQPAIFALEYSLAQLWLSWGVRPSVVMGHSVGEYVAATIAGVFSLEDGLKSIAHRGKLMQALSDRGEMVAVFATEAQVKEVIQPLASTISIAAINSPQNIVISGEAEAIAQAIGLFASLDIKTRQLNVSHAFHSPLMQPMLAEFTKIANEITYTSPKIDIVSNVTGKLAGAEIATPQYWVDHILQPVRFAPSIESIADRDYDIFLEIGSKPILLGMGRQCLPKVEGLWLPSLRPRKEDWQQILQSLASLYVNGLDIDWQGFDRDYQRQKINDLPTYPFQRERYWLEINSQAKNTETAKLLPQQNIVDRSLYFYQIDWQAKDLSSEFDRIETKKDCWLIFADRHGLARSLGSKLEKNKQEYILVTDGDNYNWQNINVSIDSNNKEDWQSLFHKIESINYRKSISKIVYLWNLDDLSSEQITVSELEKIQQKNCHSLLSIVQNLFNKNLAVPIWIVTKGTQAIDNNLEASAIAQSCLWGLSNVIAIEHPECWGGIIDLDSHSQVNEVGANGYSPLLTAITNLEKEDRIAIRKQQIYVARLNKSQKSVVRPFDPSASSGQCKLRATQAHQPVRSQKFSSKNSEELKVKKTKSYLITGGLGALGLKLSQWLVENGAKNLVLSGRNQPSTDARQAIANWKKLGVKILVAQTDVSTEAEVIKLLDRCKISMPAIAGIIHAAGVLDDGILIEQNWERFRSAIAPKVFGAWNLHNQTQDLSLDFFVTFSSVASLIGSPGQGNYAAANACLDAIARYRQGQGLPGLSINWGPWAETGMAVKANFNRQGLNLIDVDRGLEAFSQLLSSNSPQVGVLSVEWNELSKQFPYLLESPFFENLVEDRSTVKHEQTNIFEKIGAMSADRREEFLQSYLQSAIAKILQIDFQQVSLTDSLLDMGMDSLMVMEAINQLKNDLQLTIYPREFYERPRINALAKYFAVEFAKTHLDIYDATVAEDSAIEKQLQKVNKHKPAITSKKLDSAIFILSSPRSGSTLLRVMLAGHPALYSPPELHLLPFETMVERNEELGVSQLGQGLQRAFMELKNIDAQESQKLLDRLIEENLSVQDVYGMLQQLTGDRILIDKSPTYASEKETLERAEQQFSGAKYLHLVRHPYAVIESFARMRMDKLVSSANNNPYRLAESIWATSNQNTLDFFETIDPERHHLVYYEELVSNPERVMTGVCEFLGIDFDRALLQPYQGDRMTDGVYDRSMSVGDPNFLKRDRIDAQLAETWREIKLPSFLGDFAREVSSNLNYKLPQEESELELEDTPSMREICIEIRGLKICLCSWGPEEGPLVLCLHGILEQGAAWSEVAIRLAQQGYRVIAPDLRGHGRSAHVGKGGSYNLLDFLADIDAIVENIADRAFTLVGHSLGSVIAAIFTSIRPQKVLNLILVETVLPTETEEDEAAEQLATHLDYLASPQEHPVFPDVATAADRLRQATPALSKSLAMMLAERITEPCEGGVRWRWAALLRTRAGIGFNGISKPKYLGLLKRIGVPITLIYGDKSNFNRQEDLNDQQKAMPKAERIVIPGGHNLHLEAPKALAKIISGAKALTNKLIPES
jgi:acyl transferase domain-containing protein/acyl-CoA synthetase (AMP-forming)/AMP-acid ligase II/pimeloyl-ACP methyl ester carboxylesterase/acyl carrier protein